jgi:hypothetical protein
MHFLHRPFQPVRLSSVPDNAKYMMISANENGEGIWVRRINVLTE